MTASSPLQNQGDVFYGKMLGTEAVSQFPQRIPVLTMTLITLNDTVETFCQHLTDATYTNAQAACLVLDSAATKASSKPSSPAPKSSPSRSPIRRFFTNTSETSCTQKREWEKACNPLIMFAGLEAIYSACSHLKSPVEALTLVKMYKRNIEDLRHIREVLCDPFVYSATKESLSGSDLVSSYQEKAATLSISIEALMSVNECRCGLIEQQTILCSSEIIDAEKIISSLLMILHNMPKQAAKSASLVYGVKCEVEGWCNIMKAYFSFQKYRFMNSIVGCQKIKLALNTSRHKSTYIQKWMCSVYKSFVSILPIYHGDACFDVNSCYGFKDSSISATNQGNRFGPNDLEVKLDEFLQFEDRCGASVAIAVVADVTAFHTLRSKSNHSLLITGKEKSLSSNQYDADHNDSEYHALYFRGTIDHNSSKKISASRGNHGKKDCDHDHLLKKKHCRGISLRTKVNCWPYTSWNNITLVLKNTLLSRSKDDSAEIDWSQVDSETLVYASCIHSGMWFVAMKKIRDEIRRNDDEHTITKERQFLTDFQSSLRLRDTIKSDLRIKDENTDPLLKVFSDTFIRGRFLDTNDLGELVESFKKLFGLNSQGHKHSLSYRKIDTKISPKFLKIPSAYPSHYAFFLGNDLVDLLGDE